MCHLTVPEVAAHVPPHFPHRGSGQGKRFELDDPLRNPGGRNDGSNPRVGDRDGGHMSFVRLQLC